MSVRFYRWNYAWQTLKELYIHKQKEISDRTNTFCEFLVTLTTAALGGGSSSKDEITLDEGEGKSEMSDEQLEMWREILGEAEFQAQYGEYL